MAIKPKKMRWAEYVARVWEMRSVSGTKLWLENKKERGDIVDLDMYGR
jgi:hypothetical protein